VIKKGSDNILPAVLSHHVVKTGVRAVGYAPALREALDDASLNFPEHTYVLRKIGDVADFLLIGEELGDRFRQNELISLDRNDSSGSHGAEPFANITFIEVRCPGELFTRARAYAAKSLKEAGAMSDRNHQAQRTVVQDFEIARAEFVVAFGCHFGFTG
jgi:hypothetical protein